MKPLYFRLLSLRDLCIDKFSTVVLSVEPFKLCFHAGMSFMG